MTLFPPLLNIFRFDSTVVAFVVMLSLPGCMMVGPDYVRPPAPTAEAWIEPADFSVKREPADLSAWWTVLNDPILNTLIETSYRQNPSLRAAGVRVLEAQARRGIVIGQLFPQQQEGFGSYTRNDISTNKAGRNSPFIDASFNDWQLGFDVTWELDLWGRFRRGIETADAELLASVATYDDVLVSLIAEVASNYVQLRTLEERRNVARANVLIQERSFELADLKFRGGVVTELDASQAAALLRDTQAQIPDLEAAIRQAQINISVLLGISPQTVEGILGGTKPIPTAPAEVAVGIPADLLRRRPDIRRAERLLAAQSAQIGVAEADLWPSFSLIGTLSITSEKFTDLFKSHSLENFGGPGFRWAILNYGRIQNNIRVQDARFQALADEYENTVRGAQGEVEKAIAAYLGAQWRAALLTSSVKAATRAVELAEFQYREGQEDYTRVLTTQQFLVAEQDRLVSTQGLVALNLVTLYKALGGGWELRHGKGFIPETVEAQMRERTNWGALLSPQTQVQEVEGAVAGTEQDRGQWRWRMWEPQW